ncbi:unnamed protein product [Fusarium graminearum]|nr:hypothetical protein HG531_004211 [Fusarium graminearum]CAF3460269.1 unnamed protein product [Fusarium graminearum]CAG1983046.1 unnamed protein product [Fusarium graminearum]CAG1990497.1 unnamed protein product [Fusarium graminearum]VTO91102.1 unnamed protein product [Fusarium graminearum]
MGLLLNDLGLDDCSYRCARPAYGCGLSHLLRGVGEDGGEEETEEREAPVRDRLRAMNSDTGEEQVLLASEERGECKEESRVGEIGVENESNEADETLEDVEDEAETEAVEMHDKRDDSDIEADGECGRG